MVKSARVELPAPPPTPSPPPSSPEPDDPDEGIVDQDPLLDLDDSTTDIDLVHCRLNALPPSLSRFHSLTRLCVRQNQLTSIPSDLFPASGTLQELDCYDNKLKNDSLSLSTPHLSNLKILDLSFNLLKSIPSPLPPTLEVVYFVQNKISQIHLAGDACQRLRSLELGGNRIRELTGLPDLPALEELWLGKNKLTSLTALSTISLPRLRILSLQSNRITKIEGIPPSVEELYLSHNGVQKLEGLEHCLKLNTLDVGNNFIEKIEGIAHLGETLEEFWVNGNKLGALGEVLVKMEVLKKLKTVYLEANPCQAEEGVHYRRKIMLSLPWVEQIDATYVRR